MKFMGKYKIRIKTVFNGRYNLINGDKIINDNNIRNLQTYLRDKVKPADLMSRVINDIYNININFKGNICGDCALMLDCPKVRDKEKRLLESYPYITDGIEVILLDKEIREAYEKALAIYKRHQEDPDFYIDDEKELDDALNNPGIDVPVISVFGCKKFIADNANTVKKSKHK